MREEATITLTPVERLKDEGGHVRPMEDGYPGWVARMGTKVATGDTAKEAAENLLILLGIDHKGATDDPR